MNRNQLITILVILIAFFSAVATITGIVSDDGPDKYEYTSIRGEQILIYGKGLYRDMSADVAIQGIAQDYITLFIGIPLLLWSFFLFRKNNIRGLFMLSGTLFYFLVTYLFYTAMAMFNSMYLVYVTLLALSFFAFILTLFCYDFQEIKRIFNSQNIVRYGGLFLVIDSIMVAMMWLSMVIPPLLDGSVYPNGLQHYTTLIVQGFDLGLLLPIGIVVGELAFRKNHYGYLFTTIYLIFLSMMMAALTSKILFMAHAGQNVIPVIFIMPTVCVIAFMFSLFILKNLKIKPGVK